jgi:uncharacterized protein YndB with AHSA1/START domain
MLGSLAIHRSQAQARKENGPMTPPDVSAQTNITGKAMDVWSAVADPRRLTEWSPESSSVRCDTEGALPMGAMFYGSNQNGRRQWSTRCQVIESEPGRAFAFDVTFKGMAVARWRYEITDGPDGVCVEEQWWERRGVILRLMGSLVTGVLDRRAHNEAGMKVTLAALKADMEA